MRNNGIDLSQGKTMIMYHYFLIVSAIPITGFIISISSRIVSSDGYGISSDRYGIPNDRYGASDNGYVVSVIKKELCNIVYFLFRKRTTVLDVGNNYFNLNLGRGKFYNINRNGLWPKISSK